ncbi:MAG: right-handed parallel beta-helix repeat-containing protein [Bacillota bacterium]
MIVFLLLAAAVIVVILITFARRRRDHHREERLLIVPDQYSSLDQAIREASDGDTVLVRPGVYSENVDFMGKEIRVTSEDPGDREIVRRTVIDGGGRGAAVFFGREEPRGATIEGFTITGGSGCLALRWSVLGESARAGGGVFIGNGSNPTIRRNMISGNEADMGGGIYVCASSAALIEETEVEGNSAVLGGGLRVARDFPRSEGASSRGSARSGTIVRRCRFTGNGAEIGGGASISRGVSPQLSGNLFSANTATWDGGGMAIWDHSSPRVLCSEFRANSVGRDYGFGAGLSVMNDSRPHIEGNRFEDNEAVGRRRSGGGAMAIYRSDPTLVGNVARGNRAGLGCSLYLWGDARPEMRGNEIDAGDVFVRPSQLSRVRDHT